MTRFSLDGGDHSEDSRDEKHGNGSKGPNLSYDPDLAHPAADYRDASRVQAPSGVNERKLLAKIDMRVVPVLSVMYLLAFLDRTNISNAAVFGLAKDLRLKGTEYNTALVIFFVPYVLFEIPSNIILKRLKAHVWLSICMFLFGLVTVCQGLVHNYGGLLTVRFFLGLFESGMFPGSFYLLSTWYTRREAQKRFTFFFASTTLAGAFGGLLASAIGKIDGARGLRAWRWIFIIEGAFTCLVAFAWFFAIPDFPEQAKWLTEEEREFIKTRLQVEAGNSDIERKITVRDVLRCFKDFKVIIGGFMYFGLIVPAYGYAYFAPTIIRGYGYTPIGTQLHSVPPWVAAFGFSMLIATLSDCTRHRFLFAIFPICVAITGFAILLSIHHNLHAEYAALFLVTSGVYSAMPVIVCWFNMNLGGHTKRAVASGWIIGFGNTGGIIASYSFQSNGAKTYWHMGYSICVGFICLSAISVVGYFIAVYTQNKNRNKTIDAGLTEYEKAQLGDMSPDYRYML